MNGTNDKTNYDSVIEVDGIMIFKNDKHYFIFEHTRPTNGEYYGYNILRCCDA